MLADLAVCAICELRICAMLRQLPIVISGRIDEVIIISEALKTNSIGWVASGWAYLVL